MWSFESVPLFAGIEQARLEVSATDKHTSLFQESVNMKKVFCIDPWSKTPTICFKSFFIDEPNQDWESSSSLVQSEVFSLSVLAAMTGIEPMTLGLWGKCYTTVLPPVAVSLTVRSITNLWSSKTIEILLKVLFLS